MHVGLIGGIGPAATDYYYRRLIAGLSHAPGSLEVTIVHADSPTLLEHLSADDQQAQTAIFERLTRRLKAAGAGCVAVTSIAGHFCIEPFKHVSPLPVVDLLDSVATWTGNAGYRSVGLLGTRSVMTSNMYGRLPVPNVVIPAGDALDAVHQNYVDMAVSGVVSDTQREVFFEIGRSLCENHGAEAILLAGTDLVLAFDGTDCGFDTVDCASLHVEDLIREAAR